jgi:GNAT superfamily N-acetyltransferase
MLINEVITEGATPILFHYAGITSARDILRDGVFKLSSTTGNSSEAGYAPRGYQYFLSTTRSKVGDYHRFVGSGAAMFVLDGTWFSQRYPVKPIDYWERAWQHSPDRTRESEDRVFSRDNTIPIDGVRALHVLMKEQSEVRSPATREMLIAAKQRGIPAYLYMDERAWRLQDTRRAVSIQQAAGVLRGPRPSPRSYRSRNFLEEILEMIFKKSKSELTDGAQKRVRNLLIYGSRHPTEDDGLGVDMSNARKPNSSDYASAVKINQFMRAHGLKNTVELKNFLVQKWEATDFFKEDINEVFDQPYQMKWEKGEFSDYDALAKLRDGSNLHIMFEKVTPYEWNISFYRNNSQEVTGEGDAQRVFATVLAAIQKFIKKEHPVNVSFSASKQLESGEETASRVNLYNKMIRRYAQAWGYHLQAHDNGDAVMYELTSQKHHPEESPFSEAQENPVKFDVHTPDNFKTTFQITLTVHGKHVGHFNFVRDAETDDVNNEVEVDGRFLGQGYGKLLLLKAIAVANDHGLDFQQDIRGITPAQQRVYDSLENAGLIVSPGDGFWFLTPAGEQELP